MIRSDDNNLARLGIVESTVQIGGYETRVLEIDGAGTPLLLLHGFADDVETWLPLLGVLTTSGRRAVAVDLPGFGQADDLPRDGGFLPPLDRFVAAAVEHLGARGIAPVVVGNSLGGVLALRAVQNPTITLSGAVPISPAGFGHVRWVNLLARAKGLEAILFRPVEPMRVFRFLIRKATPYLVAGNRHQLLPGQAARFADQFQTHGDVRRLLGGAPTVLTEADASAVNASAALAPVQVLWGRLDRLTLSSGAPRLQAAFPAAVLVLLEGLGHCPQLEDPEAIAGRPLNFWLKSKGSKRHLKAWVESPITLGRFRGR